MGEGEGPNPTYGNLGQIIHDPKQCMRVCMRAIGRKSSKEVNPGLN